MSAKPRSAVSCQMVQLLRCLAAVPLLPTRILTDDQLADYQPWFDNQRRLRDLITELETLSQQIADHDPRWQR
jgi:hypothetical protein